MFKVGDRVWIKDMKEFGIIQEIKGDDYHSDLESGIDFSHFDNIHQTADDMFKELGYKMFENDILIQYDKFIRIRSETNKVSIRFFKSSKRYILFGITYIDKKLEADNYLHQITIKEHQAIHQKMIEMGYIEL